VQKIILMSVLFLLVAAPAVAARDRRPLLGVKRTFWWTAVGVLAYAFAVVLVYPFFVH